MKVNRNAGEWQEFTSRACRDQFALVWPELHASFLRLIDFDLEKKEEGGGSGRRLFFLRIVTRNHFWRSRFAQDVPAYQRGWQDGSNQE